MKNVAIIGAGLAGLTLANRLSKNVNVFLIEKSRGVGGRMATRRIGGYDFDHGAQFFTARSQAFKKFLTSNIESGDIAEWKPRITTLSIGKKPYARHWFEPHYVGAPAMTSLCKKMASEHEILFKTQVSKLTKDVGGWRLNVKEKKIDMTFDWVISTAPAIQTCELMADHLPKEFIYGDDGLMSVIMEPCFSLMLSFEILPTLFFDCAKVNNSTIEWIMLNSSKPGREKKHALVIQTSNSWAIENLERPSEEITEAILEELALVLPFKLPEHIVSSLQRWRYSRVVKSLKQDYLLDPQSMLAGCGDWGVEGRVEGAFISAMKLADALEEML
jgi:renalase